MLRKNAHPVDLISRCLRPLMLVVFFAGFAVLAVSPAKAAEMFCVIDELLPILEHPGGSYTIDDGYADGEHVLGIVVYGNHVETAPVDWGAFGKTWVELMDPDGGNSLGFIEKRGIEPLPQYDMMPPTPFVVRRDDPDLLLQPGKTSGRYSLSSRNYSLAKGEVVTAFGLSFQGDAEWLLLGFSTSVEHEGTGGIGMRYAWARSGDLAPLAGYTPNYAENEDAWMPVRMRATPSNQHKEGRSEPFEAVPNGFRAQLLKDGFAIDGKPTIPEYIAVDDMCDLYSLTGNYNADFITADLFLHAYHLIFSRMLQKFEQAYLAPTLRNALSSALENLEHIKADLPDELREERDRAADMLAIPFFLLGEYDESDLSERARSEVRKIMDATAREPSLITGSNEDYTQYRPRGHYLGIPELEAYFRAVNFLGNAGLPLFEKSVPLYPNIAAASILVLALDAAGEPWTSYEESVDFLMGTPDDVPFRLYRDIVRNRVDKLANARALADRKTLALIADDIATLASMPRIRDRETGNISKEEEEATRTPEFRISGKRFTFDAYAMNQLTSPRVGTDEAPRNLPEGTDVMAVLGSSAADDYAKRNNRIARYGENLARLKGEAGGFIASGDTAYTGWLKVLRTVFEDSGSKQVFYRSVPWQWKKLLTASASWAELKHDTVLYAKQSGAEMGGGGEWFAGRFAPPMPRGYVEPDPQAFAAIVSALDRLFPFLERFSADGDNEEYADKIGRLRELCVDAATIAEREVRDETLSTDDYHRIKAIARAFTAQLLLPYGMDSGFDEWEKLRMAVITDVATDFMEGLALHVGVGTPRTIYAFVNDRSGGPRIAKGYVYSYYEFPHPLSEGRMTDDEWREIVYDRERADDLKALHPDWYEKLEVK